MCWFSADRRIATRKAIEGEELIIHDFPGNHNRWLVSAQNRQKAVCLADGCKLRLNSIPEEMQRRLRVGSEAVAEFREVYQPAPTSLFERILPRPFFYDVLVLADGNRIEISRLPLTAQATISQVLGRDDRDYRAAAAEGGFRVENARHDLSARFSASRA